MLHYVFNIGVKHEFLRVRGTWQVSLVDGEMDSDSAIVRYFIRSNQNTGFSHFDGSQLIEIRAL